MKSSKNKYITLALIFTLIAVGIHAYLTKHFFDLKLGLSEGPSICNINEVMNCDAVTASKYASLLGIPMALWGLATNLVLLYFLLVTHFNLVQDKARTSRYAFLLSGVTVIASVVMGVISATAIGNICLFCVAAYVLSFFGFAMLWLGAGDLNSKNLIADIKSIFGSEKWVLGFAIAIPAFAALANLMILESSGAGEMDKITTEKVAYWNAAPQQTFDPATGLMMQTGTSEPVMTIVEFADFRCPHCKLAAPSLHAFVKSHPDVKLIFKPFPLDGTCNDAIKNGGDGISCGLAYSVMCAEKMAKKGWAAHDYIFEHQQEITMAMNLDKNLEEVSKALSLNLEELKTCVKDPATQSLVRTLAKEGETAQIGGTPSVFVNNKLLSGGQMLPILEGAYRSLKK